MNENEQPETETDDSTISQAEADEKTIRILELEHLVMLQGNTITAFSNRNHELEMRIVELMSQLEFNSHVRTDIPGPPATIPHDA